jgi:hypothetical protein
MNPPDPKTHPTMDRLESYAAGDHDAWAQAHIATCEACGKIVGELRDELAQFRARNDASAFLDAVIARASAEELPARETPSALPASSPAAKRDRRPARWTALRWAPPVLMAAVVLFMLRTRLGTEPVTTGEATQMPSSTEIRFKGAPPVAAVLERGPVQSRLTGEVHVRAGDRLRVEATVEAAGPLMMVLLSDEGKEILLQPPEFAEVGVMFSREAVRFDAEVYRGHVLVGDPDHVRAAVQTRRFDKIGVLRIISE